MEFFIPTYGDLLKGPMAFLKIFIVIASVALNIFFFYLGITSLFKENLTYTICVILFLITTATCVPFLVSKAGLHIKNDDIVFYKGWLKKKYSIDDFAGVLVLKTQVRHKYGSPTYVSNFKGEYEYSIVYLNEVLPEFSKYKKGNIDFLIYYPKYVIFNTTYDERVIGYFKDKNVPVIFPEKM
ncbi:MAG: hypothetical protein IJC81_02030 [Clostridia bacterium]|nr:hypothetical protein [Clostridia bacterium]